MKFQWMEPKCSTSRTRSATMFAAAAASVFAVALSTTASKAAEPMVSLGGKISPAIAMSHLQGPMARTTTVQLAITLPLRNKEDLDTLVANMYKPGTPYFGSYLSAPEFAARFGPSQADYDAVAAYAKSKGLSVTGTHSNRLILDVSGPASAVESAFGVHMNSYLRKDGKIFFAPDSLPKMPASIAGKVSGVAGLSNAFQRHPNYITAKKPGTPGGPSASFVKPAFVQGGSYMGPEDMHLAYENYPLSWTGKGQNIAVFELSGVALGDMNVYAGEWGLPLNPTIQVIHVDGAPNVPDGSGGDVEVDLDLQVQEAIAPQASKYMMYLGPNSDAGVVDTYNKIATDNIARSVSTSWGLWEDIADSTTVSEEHDIFEEMAAQGQTVFAASGDYGAYDPYTGAVSVQDPASQPYLSGVGGTTLSVNSDGSYASETTWWDGYTGSGGGVSNYWSIPDYQTTMIPFADWASYQLRNVPDVSADSDPNTGYWVYNSTSYGGWIGVGGTSAAAPLWSGYIAIANHERAGRSLGPVGFLNPFLYNLYYAGWYSYDMHDIDDGSNNGVYTAGYNYDAATGLGSANQYQLNYELVQAASGYAPPLAPATCSAVVNGPHKVTVTWSKSLGATKYLVYRFPGPNYPPLVAVVGGTSFVDTSVAHGTTYEYNVRAVNKAGYASGYSPYSNSVTP